MAKKQEATETVNMDALRAQIEAELREQLAAEQKAKQEEEAKEEARQERALAKQEKSVLAQLKAEKHVTIHIPENPLNPNEVVPVGWNGVIYSIPVGQDFDVPETIYNIWRESYNKTREANRRMEAALTKELKIL